jgi:hypothetical protein
VVHLDNGILLSAKKEEEKEEWFVRAWWGKKG